MYIEWTSNLRNEDDKRKFEDRVFSAKDVLDRLLEIIEIKEKALDRSETNIDVYNTPSWDYRQAHKNGNRESLSQIKKLIDLDQQKRKKD